MSENIPFWDLYEPIATLLRPGPADARRKIAEITRHARIPRGGWRTTTMKRTVRTPAGNIEMIAMNDGRISASLHFNDEMKFAQREVIILTMALPDTALAACIGRRLREVVDLGDHFPGRDAVIVSSRRVVRSTRLAIDVPRASLTLQDIAPRAR